ncbi:WD40-repeat-containing domain protein, partial [Chytriomyces cf. hyalinus JEL632]
MSTNSNLPPIAAKPTVVQATGKIPSNTKRAAPANAGAFSVAAIAQLALERKKRTMKLISKMNKDNLLKDKALYRTEREINLNQFRELMTVFQNRGNKSMTMEDFKGSFGMILGEGLNDEQMALLFIAELFEVPNPMNPTPKHSSPHRESIVNVVYLDHNKKYVTCSREGIICYWSDKFPLQKCFLKVGTLKRYRSKLLGTNKNNPLLDRETPWINDMIHMKPLNKFAIASDDHEITLKIRFDLKDCNALCLDYFVDLENQDSETSTFYFGTDGGFIYTVNIINSAFSNKNDNTKNKCVTILMDRFGRGSTKGMGSMSKRRAHDNWIGKIKYYHDLHAIVSCSIDPFASLVVALQDGKNLWTYFSAPVNHGVNTFTYSRFPVALITGGTEHQLRLWNPHRLKNPMASGQVISLSADNSIKVWDIRKQQCVQTLFDSEPLGIDDALNRIYFTGPTQGKLFALARNVTEYRLKEKTADVSSKSPSAARSHEYPLRAALYNPTFKQVVTACDGGVVHVWDALSGLHIFKFAETHGKSELTAATFDLGYRKLITGARDGTIHMWNFHKGQKIKELIKPDSAEVTEIIARNPLTRISKMHDTRYIIAVGWNLKVTIFAGNNDSDKEYPCSIYPKGKNTPPWRNDDVMCIAFAPPNVLVTASFDEGFGFMLKKLRWPDQEAAALNKSIEQVVFLHERLSNHAAATLLTAGGDGVIRWWRTNEAELMWEMNGVVGREGESIYAMCTNPSNSLLITGDTAGWVTIYSIKDTCIDGRVDITPPKTLVEFRAHLRCIVTLDIIETGILTGSTDGTSRLFTCYTDFEPRCFDFCVECA